MNAGAALRLLRPWQWVKNLMVFFPPALSGAIVHPGMAACGILPFAAFCCASSATYVFNDLVDLDRDCRHPDKKQRPLPSNQVSRVEAAALGFLLVMLTFFLGHLISPIFTALLVAYLIISAAYSLFLKHFPIVDVFCISLGFVLRLYAGGEAFDVHISDWLFLTVFLLAVFLSVGKRHSERRFLGETAGMHRRSLEVYPDGFLECAMYLSGAAVLVTYAIYSAISFPMLVYTVPLCMYGLLRYMMRVQAGESGDPTEALMRDFPLLTTAILWVIMVGWSIYR